VLLLGDVQGAAPVRQHAFAELLLCPCTLVLEVGFGDGVDQTELAARRP
jgi:tRNA G46 methylase TrmB